MGDKSATEVDVSEGVLIYEQTVDALSAMWHYNDTESQIVRAWYSVGTYPYSQDIASRKEVTMSSTLSSFLANNEVTPDITGKNQNFNAKYLFIHTFYLKWQLNVKNFNSKLFKSFVLELVMEC